MLKAVGDVLVRDGYLAVGGSYYDVEDVEQFAGIAAREPEQGCGFLDFDFAFLEFGVGLERPVEERLQILVFQRFQNVDLAAAQQRRDNLERGVFGRGADKGDYALFNGAQ